jgi:hypothetical protein
MRRVTVHLDAVPGELRFICHIMFGDPYQYGLTKRFRRLGVKPKPTGSLKNPCTNFGINALLQRQQHTLRSAVPREDNAITANHGRPVDWENAIGEHAPWIEVLRSQLDRELEPALRLVIARLG